MYIYVFTYLYIYILILHSFTIQHLDSIHVVRQMSHSFYLQEVRKLLSNMLSDKGGSATSFQEKFQSFEIVIPFINVSPFYCHFQKKTILYFLFYVTCSVILLSSVHFFSTGILQDKERFPSLIPSYKRFFCCSYCIYNVANEQFLFGHHHHR